MFKSYDHIELGPWKGKEKKVGLLLLLINRSTFSSIKVVYRPTRYRPQEGKCRLPWQAIVHYWSSAVEQRSWWQRTQLQLPFLDQLWKKGKERWNYKLWSGGLGGWPGGSRFTYRTCKQAGTSSFLPELQLPLGETAKLFTKHREA